MPSRASQASTGGGGSEGKSRGAGSLASASRVHHGEMLKWRIVRVRVGRVLLRLRRELDYFVIYY